MSVPFVLADGGAGEVHAIDGEWLDVFLPRAFAPGTPIRAEILLGADARLPIDAKVVRVRADGGGFVARIRLQSMRGQERERIRAALGLR